jgi:hypothetical protein
MLLRRVSDHLAKQAWTAIAIDFLITVLGVFIGLQASNWNEARLDRERAHGYLERIHADLDADLRNYRNRLSFWAAVSTYGRSGLAYAETGAGGDDKWALVLAYFQASQVEEYFTTRTTYEELRSAGQLNLISDLSLRNDLASYYTNAANPTLSERPIYRMHVRGLIPLEVQTYIWLHCYSTDAVDEQQLRPCASPLSEAKAAHIADALKSDQALMGELRYWMSTLDVASLIGQQRIVTAQRISALVERDLRR